jgi:hypothetical protein
MSVSAKVEIAALTLDEAVSFMVNNDDLEVPKGQKPVSYLCGVVSVGLVAEIYGVTPERVARLALTKMRGTK